MKKIYLTLIGIFLMLSSQLMAQTEICDNGTDDDGDGFIDCYDKDCAGKADACKGFYMGDATDCEVAPTQIPTFSIKLEWSSDDQTAATWSRVSVGDLDGNGIPEVVVTNRETQTLSILAGNTGKTIQQISLPYQPEHGVTIGDIDRDGNAEFFVSGRDRTIEAYRLNTGTMKFESFWKTKTSSEGGHEKGRPVVLGLADFNQDGKAELYYKNEIRDAETGLRLVNGIGNWEKEIAFAPVAVDILENGECTDCSGLELVSGGTIYSVYLGNGTKDSGKLTAIKSIPNYSIKEAAGWNENFSSSSVADYNQDGFLDVIASGAINTINGSTAVFFWDVKNNKTITYLPPNNWNKGTGRLNVADIDGDGQLNVTFVSGKALFALDENFELKWEIVINEITSGATGTTVFDFNGDGAYETVYRDEKFLYIIDGDGNKKISEPCPSRTSSEYPVVADVDGDGATEICVVCNTDSYADNANDNTLTKFGHVRLYKSDGEHWVPSRKVWNQHTYFNVNVNDDLTIPRQMQKHHLTFGDGNCIGGMQTKTPLNTFLNQSPYLKIDGCPAYGAPDFTMVDNSLTIKPPTCPDGEFTVSFKVKNVGDVGVSGDVPVTFYQGDPFATASIKLNTEEVAVNKLNPGDILEVTDIKVSGTGAEFMLFVSFNDQGTSEPAVTEIPFLIAECDPANNLASKKVVPAPFTIAAAKLKDHVSCDPSATGNGAAEAWVPENGNKITAGYNFYWYGGTDVTASPVFTGAKPTTLPAGKYTVVAENDGAKCKSNPQEIIIAPLTPAYKLGIEVVSGNTNCKTQLDGGVNTGELRAYIYETDASGNETEVTNPDFRFSWYNEQSDIGDEARKISANANARKLKSKSYYVFFQDLSSGCNFSGSELVPDQTAKLSLTLEVTKNITRCDDREAGEIKATVTGPNNHKIFWYDVNKVPLDGHGKVRSGLKAGTYFAQAVENNSSCSSEMKEIKIEDLTSEPVFKAVTEPNTACDPALSNGAITLNPKTYAPGSEPAGGYKVDWYKGAVASGSSVDNANIDDNGLKLIKLQTGTYTARLTNKDSKCFKDTTITIISKQFIPKLIFDSQTPNTVCSEDNDTDFSGRLNIRLELDGGDITGTGLNDYNFVWTAPDNTVVTPTAASNGLSIENAVHGSYTVEVTNTKTGCTSSDAFFIDKSQKLPTVELTPVHATNCSGTTGNGKISAEVKLEGITLNNNDYSIKYFNEAGTALPAANLDGNKAINLDGGKTYKAVVTLDATNCTVEDEIFIEDKSQKPVLSLAGIVHNDVCDPSSITVGTAQYKGLINLNLSFEGSTVPNPGSDYTISWEKLGNNGNSQTLSGTGLQKDNLTSGRYRITATHNTLGCTSEPYIATIDFNKPVVTPVLSMTAAQTHCDASTPNGELSVQMTDAAGNNLDNNDFTYSWKDADGTEVGTSTVLDNRAVGTYYLTATSKTTGCTYTNQKQVTNAIVNPVISTVNATDANCNNQGELQAVLPASGGAPADYTFYWYDKDNQEILSGAGQDRLQEWAGTYSVIAEHTATKCKSPKNFGTIGEPAINFRVEPEIIANPADCAAQGGELGVKVYDISTGADKTGEYTFTWYEGQVTNPPATPYTNPQATFTGPPISPVNLQKGYYTVVAKHTGLGCEQLQEIFLPYLSAKDVVVKAAIKEEENCDATGDGEIRVFIEPTTLLAGTDQNNYFYDIYKGTNPVAGVSATIRPRQTGVISPTVPGAEFTGLEPGTYTILAFEDQSGLSCAFNSIEVEVPQHAYPPLIINTDITHSTQCSDQNGSIKFTAKPSDDDQVLDATSDYNYVVYDATGTNIAKDKDLNDLTGTINGSGIVTTLNGLIPGSYTLSVTAVVSACISEDVEFEIFDQAVSPDLLPADISVDDQNTCSPPNGKITVDANKFPTTDYSFSWEQLVSGTWGTIPGETSPVLADKGAGEYRVTITKTAAGTGFGCFVISQEITINEIPNDLQIAFSSFAHNTNCGTANGSLVADVTINGAALSAGSNYEWFISTQQTTAGNPYTDITPGTPNEIAGLATGWYMLRATDAITGCPVSKSFEIKDQPVKPYVTSGGLDVKNQTLCSPNGSLTVDEFMFNGTTYNHSNLALWTDFNFIWRKHETNGTTPAVLPSQGDSDYSRTLLSEGKYSVVVERKPNTGTGESCQSPRKFATIKKVDPQLKLVLEAGHNYSCGPYNGAITATASYGNSSITRPFTFTYELNGVIKTVVSNNINETSSATYNDLAPGTYNLRVDDGLGCFLTKSVTVLDETLPILLRTVGIQAQELCNESGSIEVGFLNTSFLANDYTFTWYDGNYDENNPGQDVIQGVSGTVLNKNNYTDMKAGTYYVVASKNADPASPNAPLSGCSSPAHRVIVPEDITYPLIELVDYRPVTSCQTGNGSLSVTVDGGNTETHPDYTFIWTDQNNNPVGNSSIIQDLVAGTYTVTVKNIATGCEMSRSFVVEEVPLLPLINASATGFSSCIDDKGAVFANRVVENFDDPDGRTFEFFWYKGEISTYPGSGTADYLPKLGGETLGGLEPGMYTVFAVEQGGFGCVSLPETVEVKDMQLFPVPTATMDAGVVNCDPARPDGQVSAHVNGDFISYNFRWYSGTEVDESNFITEKVIANKLPAGNYTVQATHKFTGCSGTAQVSISEAAFGFEMKEGDIEVTPQTSCDEPNGTLNAAVKDKKEGYTFHWFYGDKPDEAFRIKGQNGPVLKGMESGAYTVYAVLNRTGCSSNPVMKVIDLSIELPEIDVLATPATCGEPNGTATLVDLKGNVASITWNIGGETTEGAYTLSLPVGDFSVTVKSHTGCETTKAFTVPVEIKIFNGITDNNDGENDYFTIDCIEFFVNNNVKVYNRAGTLVYEMDGYNNSDKVFTGTGNKGLYLGSSKLPPGTYFFVVNKNDGSDPKSGYLELLR